MSHLAGELKTSVNQSINSAFKTCIHHHFPFMKNTHRQCSHTLDCNNNNNTNIRQFHFSYILRRRCLQKPPSLTTLRHDGTTQRHNLSLSPSLPCRYSDTDCHPADYLFVTNEWLKGVTHTKWFFSPSKRQLLCYVRTFQLLVLSNVSFLHIITFPLRDLLLSCQAGPS